MPTNTLATLWPLPVGTDDPDVVDDMTKLAKAIEKNVIGIYTTAADRDAKTVAAGVVEGMFAFTKDTNSVWYYDGTAWVTFPPRQQKIGNGPSVPSNTDTAYVNGDVFFKV